MSTLDTIPAKRTGLLHEYTLRLADDRLILGQRLSEWCAFGPELEEDLALANIALDMIGHSAALYELAADISGVEGRDEDYYAYFRDDIDFKNLKICELPIGDFAFTIARQFLFSAYSYFLYNRLLEEGAEEFRGILSKHFKEIKYHLRHSREWLLRLGDGTEESHTRLQNAVDDIWMYTGEFFDMDKIDQKAIEAGIGINPESFYNEWKKLIVDTLEEATIEVPDFDQYMQEGGRRGFHTEHLGHLLAKMQFLRRSYPDAEWK